MKESRTVVARTTWTRPDDDRLAGAVVSSSDTGEHHVVALSLQTLRDAFRRRRPPPPMTAAHDHDRSFAEHPAEHVLALAAEADAHDGVDAGRRGEHAIPFADGGGRFRIRTRRVRDRMWDQQHDARCIDAVHPPLGFGKRTERALRG